MTDTTIKKIDIRHSPKGAMGQTYLVSGKEVAMRRWHRDPGKTLPVHGRPYETVGYVISGEAELDIGGQRLRLQPGDSWLVPAQTEHRYRILETFEAIEATSPPARVYDRDVVPQGG